jgi:uncharacterized membrane protein YtjA (UPF0391 family)|tara:strand:- start:533 stop:790 length:258 start_codon:yes stop_codon:yes gene_type:complete
VKFFASAGTQFEGRRYLVVSIIGKDSNMLRLALAFFIVAIIAAVFGFGGIAAGAASIAQILFFLFVVLFLIALVVGLIRGRSPRI